MNRNQIKALISQYFNRDYHPQNWKIAKDIILAKSNKSEKSILKAYRVISLLNYLSKVIEKLATTFIANYYEKYDILYNSQFNYRRNRSTIDIVVELISIIEKA